MPLSLKRALSTRSSSKRDAASAPASDAAEPSIHEELAANANDADAEALRKETLAAQVAAEVRLPCRGQLAGIADRTAQAEKAAVAAQAKALAHAAQTNAE
jgi:hypothetical protein